MRHDTRLLLKETWELAVTDQLKEFGIKMRKPRVSITNVARCNSPRELSALILSVGIFGRCYKLEVRLINTRSGSV